MDTGSGEVAAVNFVTAEAVTAVTVDADSVSCQSLTLTAAPISDRSVTEFNFDVTYSKPYRLDGSRQLTPLLAVGAEGRVSYTTAISVTDVSAARVVVSSGLEADSIALRSLAQTGFLSFPNSLSPDMNELCIELILYCRIWPQYG